MLMHLKNALSEEMESVAHTKDPIAPVAYLKFNHLRLIDKVCYFEKMYLLGIHFQVYRAEMHLVCYSEKIN